jgi:O-succinylbenzoate synthase
VKTWIDFDAAPVFAIPLTDGPEVCEGMLLEGPQGWGEFSAPRHLDERGAARWLTAAIEVGTVGWPDPVRGRVPVAVTVPAVGADRAHQIVTASGCRTAAVTVGAGSLADDIARLEAVRDALGPDGAIRCDAGGAWDADGAVAAVPVLARAAGGLEFIEHPCTTLVETVSARKRLDVPVAVGRLVCESDHPLDMNLAEAADIAVLTVSALGGVRRALRFADHCGLPCVVSSARESTIGSAGGLALAGVLPDPGFAHQLGGVALLSGDLVSSGRSLIPVDGHLPVAPMPPGPDPALLERFAADPARVSWWRARVQAVAPYI